MSTSLYAHVELLGMVRSTPEPNGLSGDLWATVSVDLLGLSFKVIAPGDTLEGFSSGDLLHVKGNLRRSLAGTLVIRATTAETPA